MAFKGWKLMDSVDIVVKKHKKKLAAKEEWAGYYGQKEEKTRGRYKLIKE